MRAGTVNETNRCDPPKISVDLHTRSVNPSLVEPNNVPELLPVLFYDGSHLADFTSSFIHCCQLAKLYLGGSTDKLGQILTIININHSGLLYLLFFYFTTIFTIIY